MATVDYSQFVRVISCDFVDDVLRCGKVIHEITRNNTKQFRRARVEFETISAATGCSRPLYKTMSTSSCGKYQLAVTVGQALPTVENQKCPDGTRHRKGGF
jgi:hypothetical protein